MKFKLFEKKEFSLSDKRLIFYFFLFVFCYILFGITSSLNIGINELFEHYSISINGLNIPKLSVLIAPIVEECIKLTGYGIIFFFNFNRYFKLEHTSKKDFVNDNLTVAFLISAGGFGFFEGVMHNAGFGISCFIAFIFLNTLIHVTYSIYPYILGRRYKNWFICFLPIGILLHAIHNFFIDVIWDNKWITFTMTLIFLVPIIILEREKFYQLFLKINPVEKYKNSRKATIILTILLVILFIYIFLCCWLRF